VTKTLLVDGDNLFKIGFHGVKDLFVEDNHIGGVFHFVNTLKRFLEEHDHDKVIVFWDAESNSSFRKSLYPQYKANRKNDMNDYKYQSYLEQRVRVKQYLEEIFVRQAESVGNEADDLISFYCKVVKDEKIIIFSADKDLTQLISETVTIYSPVHRRYYKNGDKIKMGSIEIPHQNVLTYKIICGDKSDNIDGIESMGEKTLVKLFPDLLTKLCTIEEIRDNASNILQEKKGKALNNFLTGKTKSGILGEEFFVLNKKIVDLSQPLLTDDAKELIHQLHQDTIDPTDRGYKNLMKMMIEDGLFKYLPKNDEAWVNFLRPFLKLTRKEKRKIKN
jgi:5'-3' exonuclease